MDPTAEKLRRISLAQASFECISMKTYWDVNSSVQLCRSQNMPSNIVFGGIALITLYQAVVGRTHTEIRRSTTTMLLSGTDIEACLVTNSQFLLSTP